MPTQNLNEEGNWTFILFLLTLQFHNTFAPIDDRYQAHSLPKEV